MIAKDKELLDLCQKSMKNGNYDKAIEYTNQMTNRTIAIKAHLFVIEHEAATAKKNRNKGNTNHESQNHPKNP